MILVKTNNPWLRVGRHTEGQGKKAMWCNEEGTTATSFRPQNSDGLCTGGILIL
jgi:hypothetical protein